MRVILSILAVFAIAGCDAEYTGRTTNNDNSGQDHSYSYVFTEGDRDYGTGTPLFCTDANCSVTNEDNSINKGEADAIVGEYDENYTQAECNAAGFFYCTIQDKCLDQPVDDASSSCN